MRKTVIALYGTSNSGKSSTAKLVIDKLDKYNSIEQVRKKTRGNGHDLNVIFKSNTIKIGIETEGDPGTPLEKRLSELSSVGCDIIICTCRTYGKTVEAVKSACKNYDIVWTLQDKLESDRDESDLRQISNEIKADFLINIIKRFYRKLL